MKTLGEMWPFLAIIAVFGIVGGVVYYRRHKNAVARLKVSKLAKSIGRILDPEARKDLPP